MDAPLRKLKDCLERAQLTDRAAAWETWKATPSTDRDTTWGLTLCAFEPRAFEELLAILAATKPGEQPAASTTPLGTPPCMRQVIPGIGNVEKATRCATQPSQKRPGITDPTIMPRRKRQKNSISREELKGLECAAGPKEPLMTNAPICPSAPRAHKGWVLPPGQNEDSGIQPPRQTRGVSARPRHIRKLGIKGPPKRKVRAVRKTPAKKDFVDSGVGLSGDDNIKEYLRLTIQMLHQKWHNARTAKTPTSLVRGLSSGMLGLDEGPIEGDLIGFILALVKPTPSYSLCESYNFTTEGPMTSICGKPSRFQDLPRAGTWLLPVCHQSQWLAVKITWALKQITYYDPQGPGRALWGKILDAITDRLAELNKEPPWKKVEIPTQIEDHDVGNSGPRVAYILCCWYSDTDLIEYEASQKYREFLSNILSRGDDWKEGSIDIKPLFGN